MSLALLRLATLGCMFGALLLAVRALAGGAGAAALAPLLRYERYLDSALSELHAVPCGRRIVLAQAAAGLAVALWFGHSGGKPLQLLALGAAVLLPRLLLQRARRRWTRQIESQLNAFNVALANALRAAPSLGKALERVQQSSTGALAHELALLHKELRLGIAIDDALRNLARRAGSLQFEAVLGSLLIGRQIGGRIPDILDRTAETLREMERLDGVIRAKTSEGKGQLAVMALSPPVIFVVFDRLRPGYFDVLTDTALGMTLSAAAVACWLVSIALARKIVKVAA